MKKRILFVVAMYWLLGNPLFSQSLEQRVLEQLSTLDQSQTTTGILYERSLQVQPLKLLDGKTLNDSIQLSPNDFAFGYGLMQWANIDTIHRQLIDPFFELVATKKNLDTIPIGLLIYQYDRIKPWAIDSGLITYNNDHFYDVQGRSESPYIVDTTFAMSIFNSLIFSLQPVFRFDSFLFKHNLQGGISSIEINFSDGAGWIQIIPGTVIAPTFNDYDKYNIELRITLSNGVTRWCRQAIELKASSSGMIFPPEGDYSILPDDSIKIGPPGEGVMVYVFLRDKCGDKKIRKPLIIIEGFDPSNKYNWEFAMSSPDGLLKKDYHLDELPSKILHSEDYDIFFINYMKPGDYIQNNAAAVIAAIAEINHRKHLAGSVEKNVVMGASMGGLVGKYALRTMELQNLDHETEFFLSFDSPLKGANVPLGLQAMVFQLANFTVFNGKLKDKKEDLKNAYNAVNMPAAKQMLYYHYSACDQAENSKGVINCSGETFGQYHTEFQTMFDGLGNLDIPHYAICNGAITKDGNGKGQGQKFEPFAILSEDSYCLTCDEWFHWAGGVGLQHIVSIRALPNTFNYSQEIYNGKILQNLLGHFSDETLDVFINNAKPYDSSPGGMRTFNKIEDGLEQEQGAKYKYYAFTFIPTISSLALNTQDPYFSDLDLEDKENIIEQGITYLKDYEGSTEPDYRFLRDNNLYDINMEHVSLDRRIAKWFLKISLTNQELTNPLQNRKYNFGATNYSDFTSRIRRTRNTIDFNLDVKENAELAVSTNDRIAYTDDVTNALNKEKNLILLNIRQATCNVDTIIVKILENSKMTIGEGLHGFKSKVNIYNGARLLIGPTGKVVIHNESELRIKSGAVVYLEAGGLIEGIGLAVIKIENGAKLIIRNGGKILLHDESKIQVYGAGQLIIEEGAIIEMQDPMFIDGRANIHVKQNGTLQIDGPIQFLGNGHFQFDEDNILVLKDGFFLKGKEKGVQFIRLNTGAELKIQNKILMLSRGKVIYAPDSKIETTGQNEHISIDSMVFAGITAINNIATSAIGLEIVAPKNFLVRESHFAFLTSGIDAYNIQLYNTGINMEVRNSLFTSSRVEVTNGENILFHKDTFINSTSQINNVRYAKYNQVLKTGSTATLLSTKFGVFKNSQFVNCGTGISANSSGVMNPASNIFIHSCYFGNNGIGVNMDGDNVGGLVEIGCSQFFDNIVSVEGEDVLLHIDANSGAGQFGVLGGNNFKKEPDYTYFWLWYCTRSITEVLARQNYWYNYLPGTYPDDYWIHDCPQSFEDQYPLIYSPEMANPSICPEIDNTTISGCTTGVNGGINVAQDYFSAYQVFLEGNYSQAEEMMAPIAAIDNTFRAQAGAVCRKYIDLARIFAGGEGGGEPIILSNDDKKTKTTNIHDEIKLFPNPVDEILYIQLPKGNFTIQIINTHGQEFVNEKSNGLLFSCSMDHLVHSLYNVNITDSSGKLVKSINFVKK